MVMNGVVWHSFILFTNDVYWTRIVAKSNPTRAQFSELHSCRHALIQAKSWPEISNLHPPAHGCYCIIHEENILGAIFGMWKELRSAKSWEEVEEADDNGLLEVRNSCSWIHTDIMDDNIHMEQCCIDGEMTSDVDLLNNGVNGTSNRREISWRPSYIYDFSNLSIGDPIWDLIPIHLDIFRGDRRLLKQLLESYGLPFGKRSSSNKSSENGCKSRRISYLTMCYCIIHEENILGAIFGMWKELRSAKSWEEVEEAVWSDLNNYY